MQQLLHQEGKIIIHLAQIAARKTEDVAFAFISAGLQHDGVPAQEGIAKDRAI
jgi:hypothetical protein